MTNNVIGPEILNFSSHPQFHRLQAILKAVQAGGFPNSSDFSDQLEVSRRTILRDIEFLRTEWGAPIQYDESRKGYFLPDPAWTLPALKLERREVFALGIAQKLIGAFRGTPLEREMRSALARVAESLEGRVSIRPELLTQHISVMGEDYAPQDPKIWTAVLQSIERNEQIHITYCTFRGEEKAYRVDPYHLTAYHGDWYLVGWHHRRNKTATFAVSRIQSVSVSGAFFSLPDTAEIQRHMAEGFGITGGEDIMKVRLKFSASVAPYIAGRIWHPSQQMKPQKDGALELVIETRGWKELVRFILSWLPDVEVIEPWVLRERIREKVCEAYEAGGAVQEES